MNKRYIENKIPEAIELIRKNAKVYFEKEDAVPNEFMGYISSFAVSVTLSGPVQAITFYQDKGSAKFHREEMIRVIKELMEVEGDFENFINYMKENPSKKAKLLDSAITFKMALRVFALKKGLSNES